MPWLTDRRLLAAALLVWGVVAFVGVVFGPSIGHDEAAFALTARGLQPPGVWLYRSDGTVALAWIGMALGGAEWQLRLSSALLSLGAIAAVYAVGRAAFTARTGAWAAAVVAGAHPMAQRSAELLSDLPAMACLLGGVAVLIAELGREAPRWRIVWAAVLFAAAFYFRYGSVPVIAIALAMAMLLWWRAALRRPLPVLAMFASFGLLLIPHLLRSQAATGTMLGILKGSSGVPRLAYVGEGLVTYLASNPFMFYGFLVAPVMVAGLVGLVTERRKAAWYLAIVGLGQMVALGLRSHGQPRYVFFAAALLVVLGVAALERAPWLGRLGPRLALGLVVTSWLGVLVSTPLYFSAVDRAREPLVEAARAIRAHAGDRPCVIVALIVPQLRWHSGCEVLAYGLGEPVPAGKERYAASFARWPIDVPALVAREHLEATPLPTRDGRARVWTLR